MIENIYQADGCDSSPYRTYSLVDPTDMNQLIINNGKIPAAIGATEVCGAMRENNKGIWPTLERISWEILSAVLEINDPICNQAIEFKYFKAHRNANVHPEKLYRNLWKHLPAREAVGGN